jgi:ABC-type Na+ transport system ATPase subunit NatA
VLFYSLALALGFPIILQFLAMEKEENVKHLMEVNGMRVRNYWFSAVFFFFVFFSIGSVLFFLFGKLIMDDSLFQRVPFSDIATFVVCWNLNQVLFSLFMSGFLNSSGTASAIGFLISMPVNFFVASVNLNVYAFPSKMPIYYKFFPVSLLSRVLIYLMLKGDNRASEVEDADYRENITFFLINIVIYGFLGVLINEPKVRSALLNIFSCCGNRPNLDTELETMNNMHQSSLEEKISIDAMRESEIKGYAAVCKDIKKSYHRNTGWFYALKGVSLRINKGEVFGLLGPNGAGKTTFISILTGFLGKDSGRIYIDGQEVVSASQSSAKVSLCPQFDILWPTLSVYEHLKFFGLFRGLSGSKLENNIKEVLASTNLTKQKNQTISTLSGGMKRRCSLGISLIGDIEVVFLDEPSTGLDPKKRRNFWSIINGYLIS